MFHPVRRSAFMLAAFAASAVFSGCERRSTASPAASADPKKSGVAAAQPAAAKLDYNRDVQPILSNYCYHCHGPDTAAREPKAKPLRLDIRDQALAYVGDNGERTIVAGKPDKSELVRRVESHDPDEMMPQDKEKLLNPAQIKLLRDWIAQGAEFRDHWAFEKPVKAALPKVSDEAWCKTPVDRFILAKLDEAGLKPNAEADRTALIRRVTLDLTGLLPTPEEVAAFTADPADTDAAYAKVVDRLLAAPAYGENRARYWLDYARYGDTHGIHVDPYRAIWPYRDYVIKSFNEDKPFDRFATEQLAGDLMPDGDLDALVATGFVSDALPWTAKCVDDIATIHSMYSDAINHEPAIMLMNTAAMFPGRPALGAWISYGLGSMNANLPSFVVLNSTLIPGTSGQPVTPRLWSSSFLPTEHAGVALRAGTDPVLYLHDPEGMDRALRRNLLDGVAEHNERTFKALGDSETHARIAQYEMAFNMQMSVPELTDFSDEPESTWDLYGPDAKKPGTFTYNCLMARRMAERGVRFTQVYQRGWDFHNGLLGGMNSLCGTTDRGCYALITDLKRRGLLDDTLVIWGGEFGRTTYSQGDGRDHHAKCFTNWMAGGGVKGGVAHGQTDDFAFNVLNPGDKVHPRDFIATACHALGIESDRLTKRVLGVDLKPTGVEHGKVIESIMA